MAWKEKIIIGGRQDSKMKMGEKFDGLECMGGIDLNDSKIQPERLRSDVLMVYFL
jgi:hypothetical protein